MIQSNASEMQSRGDDELGTGRLRHELSGVRLRSSKQDTGTAAWTASSRHPHHELIYIEAGEGTQRIGEELLRARPGDVFLLPPDTFHRHNDPARWSTWSLSFHPDAVGANARRRTMELLSGDRPVRFSVPEKERTRWEARFEYLLSELNQDHVMEEDSVQGVMRSILRDVVRLSATDAGTENLGRKDLLDAVFAYIDAHYREPISLQDVAGAVHFSPAYLTDLIHRETGRPIHRWISERRLHAARLLLAETDRSIAAIAEEVGFRDATYFGRHFAKMNGQTPRMWREAQRRRAQGVSNGIPAWNVQTTSGALEDYVQVRALGERLGKLHTRDEVESAVLEATYTSFQPSLAQILRRDAPRRTSTVSRQLGARDSLDFPSPRDRDGALPVVVEGQTVVPQDLRRSPLETHRRIGRLGYHCLLIAPIITGSECIGAIRILERKPRAFSEHERSLLTMIGMLAGLALRGFSL